MGNTYGHTVIVAMTNKSGGAVIAGDVVIIDTTNDTAFTTTTSAGFTGRIGVAQESIANNATDRVAIEGEVALVNVNASVTRGNYGKTHTVAKQATDAGSARVAGTFCQFTTGGTTPRAILYPVDLAGAALTNPMTTTGDMIASTDNSGTPGRIAAVAAGRVLKSAGTGTLPAWGYVPFSGCRAKNSGSQNIANTMTAITFDSEDYDTDTYHDTVSNTSRFTAPQTGYYLINLSAYWNAAPSVPLYWKHRVNNTTDGPLRRLDTNYVTWIQYTAVIHLTAADYVEFYAQQANATPKALGTASYETTAEIVFLGA